MLPSRDRDEGNCTKTVHGVFMEAERKKMRGDE